MSPRQVLGFVLFTATLAVAPAEATTGDSSRSFHLKGISHLGLSVNNLEKSRVFYKAVLGFDETESLNLASGEISAALIKVNSRQTINLYPVPASMPANGENLYNLGLETDDAAAFHDYLISKGIAATLVHKTSLGDLVFELTDPSNHALEVTQYEAAGSMLQHFERNLPSERIANRLSAVSMRTTSLANSLAFYENLLAFVPVRSANKGATGAVLRVPDGTDEIILEPSKPSDASADSRTVAQYSLEQTEGSNNKAHTIFFDPDGTRLEIVAPAYNGGALSKVEPTRTLIYKRIRGRELTMDLFEPKAATSLKSRPCFVAIHGGGWTSGVPRSMFPFAARAAELGMVGISLQYRLLNSSPGVTVYDCVKDGRSAIRYLRAHAVELGIDPGKIIVAGSSAGGHVAAGTAVLDGIDETGEDTSVSCVPNAVILMSAVIDTSKEGYGTAKAGPRWQKLSPVLHVHPGLPPMLMFHGTGDLTTPFKGAKEFRDAMISAGNRCELVAMLGASHTYYGKDKALWDRTMHELETFLASLDFCKAPV